MNRLAAPWFGYMLLGATLAGCGDATLGSGIGVDGAADSGTGVAGGPGSASGVGGGAGRPSGVGGASGTGAEHPCFSRPPLENPNCLAPLCGTGAIDSCTLGAAFGACPELKATEVCDGADLGGRTCETRGFGSGTLRCAPDCADLDWSGCKECSAIDSTLLHCGDAPLSVTSIMVGIAATDTEVALAWMERDGADRPVLGFARLSPNLDVLSTSRVPDASLDLISSLQVAALPSGWVVAGRGDPDLVLHAFDAMGQPLQRSTVDTYLGEVVQEDFTIAPRPDGGPLLVWFNENRTMRAAIVAADGRSTSAPVNLATGELANSAPSVAWIGGAFYVAVVLQRPTNDHQLHLKRVDGNGAVVAAFDALPGVIVWDPTLVARADDVRVVFDGPVGPPVAGMDPPWAMQWQRFDAIGNAVGEPVRFPSEFAWGRGVAFGADTSLLLLGFGERASLVSARLASDGHSVTPIRKFAGGNTIGESWGHAIVRRGSDVVVLWYYDQSPVPGRRVQLARIAM
jgi:hypothetical protein